MNNKGFTIIELSAIVFILAIIFLISFPSLINMTKADKEKQYNNMVNNLCLSGKSYIYANLDSYNISAVGNTINISIQTLIEYGNVDSNLENPNTENSINDDALVFTVLSDYSLGCEYIDN